LIKPQEMRQVIAHLREAIRLIEEGMKGLRKRMPQQGSLIFL